NDTASPATLQGLIRSVLGAFAAVLAPAREVAFDDLAIGAGSNELTAGELDLAFTLVMRELRPQFFVESGGELLATARDVTVCKHELRRGLQWLFRRDRRRQSISRGCRPRTPFG
ncbi:MAG TPA: hypothetical protein VF403_15685, partial [Kofleriaceae bacterium]